MMLDASNLYDYQRFLVRHIIENKKAGIFFDMGAGKTVSTLTAIDFLIYEDMDISKVLVVAPKRVANNVWTDEIAKWQHLNHLKAVVVEGPEAKRIKLLNTPADIYTISRDLFVWLCRFYKGVLPFDMIVFDELSSFKSSTTERFKAAKQIRAGIKRIVGLTGTPAPNSLLDLWAQVYILDGGDRLGRFKTRFKNNYFYPHPYKRFKLLLQPNAEKAIHDAIKDICVSLKNEDLNIKMPELVISKVSLAFNEELKKEYRQFENQKILELFQTETSEANVEEEEYIKPITAANAGVLFNKLSQFANGAIYDEDKNVHHIHDVKLDALEELIEEAQEEPMMVGYAFRHDRDRIANLLRKLKIPVRELNTPKDIKDWNEGKIQVLIAHPASMGHGLNLQTGGRYLTWFSLPSSLELYQQMNARVYRQGQAKMVVINILSIKGTIDERLYEIIVDKTTTQASLINALRAQLANIKQNNIILV